MSARIERPSVEYSIVDHCNLSCHACDHASPILPKAVVDPDVFAADLRALAAVMRVRRLYIIGGEPLLHPSLVELLRVAAVVGIAERITLVTNGVLLDRAPDAMWQLIDGLDVTHYPGVSLHASDREIEATARRWNVELRLRSRDTFRQTLLNRPHADGQLVQRIYDACHIAHVWNCHSVQAGRYYKCSVAPGIPKRLRLLGRSGDFAEDGVALHDNPSLRLDLERYLADDRPLPSCAFCLGTCGRSETHRQLNAEGRRQSLVEPHHDIASLVDERLLVSVRGHVATDTPAAGWSGGRLRYYFQRLGLVYFLRVRARWVRANERRGLPVRPGPA